MHMMALPSTFASITLCSDSATTHDKQCGSLSAEHTQRITRIASEHTPSSYWDRFVSFTSSVMPSW